MGTMQGQASGPEPNVIVAEYERAPLFGWLARVTFGRAEQRTVSGPTATACQSAVLEIVSEVASRCDRPVMTSHQVGPQDLAAFRAAVLTGGGWHGFEELDSLPDDLARW